MRVNVVCRNHDDDRVLPRFSRYLRDGLGWTLSKAPAPGHDVIYLMGYFESQMCRPSWPSVPVASLFTHREESHADKARMFDDIARRVQLRVAMCRLYGAPLSEIGKTIQPPLPVELDFFTPAQRLPRARPVVGMSGYTYKTGRKGESLARVVVSSKLGRSVEWKASGRTSHVMKGWPVETKHYPWRAMPAFYQSLDVLVCPSLVEGGPMPVLEALSCGVKVVVPSGVGIVDELPDVVGICRYKRGDAVAMGAALAEAIDARAEKSDLRGAVSGYSVAAWCKGHRDGFEEAFA